MKKLNSIVQQARVISTLMQFGWETINHDSKTIHIVGQIVSKPHITCWILPRAESSAAQASNCNEAFIANTLLDQSSYLSSERKSDTFREETPSEYQQKMKAG